MNYICSHASSAHRNRRLRHPPPHRHRAHRRTDQPSYLRSSTRTRARTLSTMQGPGGDSTSINDHAVAAVLGVRDVEPADPDEHVATLAADSKRWRRCAHPVGSDPGRRLPTNGSAWMLPPVRTSARLTRHATIRHADQPHPRSECPRIRLVSSQRDSDRSKGACPSSAVPKVLGRVDQEDSVLGG